MRCDNCKTNLAGLRGVARGQNYFCSLTCAALYGRSEAEKAALPANFCYACDGTGRHEAIPSTTVLCGYCHGSGERGKSLEVPHVSVLSAEDRQTIEEARLWIRRILLVMQDSYLPGMEDGRVSHTVTLDGLERSSLYGVLEKLDDLHSRHSGEPQLANSEIRQNGCAITRFLIVLSCLGVAGGLLLAFACGWIPA